MKTITGVLIGAIVVVVVILGVVWFQKADEPQNAGSLFIGVTDASADIQNVSDISLTVDKVEIYNATQGWTTVSSDSREYQLLALKASGETKLYADAKVAAGIYNRMRVTLGDVIVKTKTNGDVKATMPSSYVLIDGQVNVKENENTHVELDFIADASLHIAQENKYVFAPVIEVESRSNTNIAAESDDTLTVLGGTMDFQTSVGVDLWGASRANFQLSTDETLRVETDSSNQVKIILNGNTFIGGSESSAEALGGAQSGGSLNIGSSTASSSLEIDGSLNIY